MNQVPFYTHRASRKVRRVADATLSADAIIPADVSGLDLFAFTAGQWSLMEMLCVLIDRMGPVDMVLSVWTAADADMRDAYNLLEAEQLRSFTMLVDRSFIGRQPEYAELAVKMFGKDALRVTRTHCKCAVLTNEKYSVVVRGSMNLNHSPRWEQLEITEDAEFARWMRTVLLSEGQAARGLVLEESDVQERLFAPFEANI